MFGQSFSSVCIVEVGQMAMFFKNKNCFPRTILGKNHSKSISNNLLILILFSRVYTQQTWSMLMKISFWTIYPLTIKTIRVKHLYMPPPHANLLDSLLPPPLRIESMSYIIAQKEGKRAYQQHLH